MFSTPKKKLQNCSVTLDNKTNGNNNISDNNDVTNSSTTSHQFDSTINPATEVFENGTMLGAVTSTHVDPSGTLTHKNLIIPEIIISASYSSNSLNRSRCDIRAQHSTHTTHNHKSEDSSTTALESTALLEGHSDVEMQQDDFEQFVLNRTTSDSNILESSIYSELQFSASIGGVGGGVGGGGVGVDSSSSGGPTAAQVAAPQQPSSQASSNVVDMLNSSACSRESRQNKRMRRKHKSKSKCSVVSASGQLAGATVGGTYPPQYTAIFLDPHHHHHHAGAANVMGQIASAAASSPFLNAPVGAEYQYQHQHLQFYQQQPMLTSLGRALSHHMSRPLLDARTTALPMCGGAGVGVGTPDGISPDAITNPAIATTSTITPPLRTSFRKWFSRPSLPFVIGILALGGVACTLGGIVLGSTGLIEHSTQYLSAALLMIGIGVSLLVISGAIWRLSLPDDVDECPCYRHMEACRNCNSPYCNNRLLPGNYLYPEFQHRPPPPSYLTSLNECAAMGLLFHPAAQPQQAFGSMRGNTPPPLYRSTNSLSVFVPGSNAATTLVAPALNAQLPNSTAINLPALNSNSSILPDQNALTMSVVMENLQAQTQPQMTKEINYLELD